MLVLTGLLSVLWVVAAAALFVFTMPVLMSTTMGTNVFIEIAFRGCILAPLGLGLPLVVSWVAWVVQAALYKTERWRGATYAAVTCGLAHGFALLWVVVTVLSIIGMIYIPTE